MRKQEKWHRRATQRQIPPAGNPLLLSSCIAECVLIVIALVPLVPLFRSIKIFELSKKSKNGGRQRFSCVSDSLCDKFAFDLFYEYFSRKIVGDNLIPVVEHED